MKAVVYHGPGQGTWEAVPDPQLMQDTDVIVGIDAATSCGTDLAYDVFSRPAETGALTVLFPRD
jgi:threonine dehydrogenase-like Zn-dependent dehydrogenase